MRMNLAVMNQLKMSTTTRSLIFTIFLQIHAYSAVAYNTPVFSQSNYRFEVPENEPGGTFIGRVSATGCSENGDGVLTYSIERSREFAIDSTGSISTLDSLDRERRPEFQFRVITRCLTSDGNQQNQFAQANVTVVILDVNDNAPRFSKYIYEVNFDWNTPVNSTIAQIRAADMDTGVNGELTYRLLERHSPPILRIDSKTGTVTLASRFPTNERIISAEVMVADGGRPVFASRCRLNVHIIIPDTPPVFNTSSYTFQVLEEFPRNYAVGKVSATSPVGISLYRIINGPEFTIDSNGTLYTAAILDREAQASFSFRVEATDVNNQSTDVSVSVIVLDVNDNAPKFPYKSIVMTLQPTISSGDVLESIVASDLDTDLNARLTYSITPRSSFLSIGSETGILTFTGNYSEMLQRIKAYTAIATVTDGGTPPRSSSLPIVLLI